MTDGDQLLAAEPGLHGKPPQGGGSVVTTIRRVPGRYSEVVEQQPENGLALAPIDVATLYTETIEPICSVVAELNRVHDEFKRLLTQYGVVGKRVHDARLVALMHVWEIENVLTLNAHDLRRYEPEGIRVVTPDSLLADARP